MSVQSVLVEYSEAETLVTLSAILFNKRWILLPAATLIVSLSKRKQMPDILQNLEPSKLFYTNYLDLQEDKLKIVTKSDTARSVEYLPANYLGIFCCKNIKDTTNFPLGCSDGTNSFDSYLSLFIFLDLRTEQSTQFEEKHLLEGIGSLLKPSYTFSLCRGNTVCVDSTPFGSRELLSSYSQGVVCNCVGQNNCYILTDAPTAPGSEGAPIFGFRNDKTNSTKIPIGIVISSINSWRGEHTGLTLGATLVPLLTQLLPKKWNVHGFLFSDKNSVMNSVDKSIVQVFCGNGWGTGILIDKANGIFITGSHVVKSGDTNPIILKWRNRQFPCTLAYRTPGVPIYDIAVLQCLPRHISEMSQVKFSTKPAKKGENVLAAGYPIFNSLDFIFPVITKGNISLTDSCILHTTCCILAGSSGGAIFRASGELLGIIVCHTTVTLKNEFVVYPKINMAIPISAISKPLLEYIKTRDVTTLATLDSKDPNVRNKWQFFQSKL